MAAYLDEPYLFNDDKGILLLSTAMEQPIEDLKTACWGWCD